MKKNHKPPTVIKIDVEGAELEVLQGGENFLRNYSPIISLEIWGKDNNGELSMKAVNFLRNLNYKSYYVNENGELEERNGDLSLGIIGFDNFIFKK
ncbi:MAG: hypothetical protein KatS3mg093_397 [Candidatus Parcubacteria bacterium]|nr:MAG: hypothetical protein KatS3mg093_397 [Candidatus Parcubacteria bacterium]